MGPKKVAWHFNSVVKWQFENVIFSQPQVLWPSNLAGYVFRLRDRLAQSQMTLLFRGHVTKTSFSLFSSLSHCLWSVGLAKDDRTSLKKFTIHLTLPPLDKLKKLYLIFLKYKVIQIGYLLHLSVSPPFISQYIYNLVHFVSLFFCKSLV